VVLKGDARRRVVPCRLETAEEKPEERTGFKYPDLLGHVRRHRGGFVAAGLTILRAYVVAGRPARELSPFGSFEAWSGLIRSAVHWVTGGLDSCATRTRLRDADPALATRGALLTGWSELPGGTGTGVTVAEALRYLRDPGCQDRFLTLREALMEWSSTDKLPGPGTIGHKLRGYRNRVVDGMALQGEPGHAGGQRWKVATVRGSTT
jgi:putative DNA primase/helicase